MSKNNHCKAAGLIIYRIRNQKPQILGLIARKKFQIESNGIYDIPKGQKNKNETPFECALRECYEEASIVPNRVLAGPFINSNCWTWVAYSDEKPVININPDIGIKEHLGYRWLPIDNMIDNCLDYLKPCLNWAKGILT